MQASQVLPQKTVKSISLWSCFVHRGIVMLKQERDKHKVLKVGRTLLSKKSVEFILGSGPDSFK